MKRVPLDVVGDIAILKFSRFTFWPFKKIYALKLLKQNPYLKVVLEKKSGFSGELRIQKTKWVAGEKRTNTIHRENDCSFYLDVDETYFSPRLSQERKIVSEEIFGLINSSKIKQPRILIMFGGVAPQAVVLGKLLKKNKIDAKIISSELNSKACEFAERNVIENKLREYISVEKGDSRKLCETLAKKRNKFDFILMLRPNLQETFLESASKVSGKGTIIYYHGFGEEGKVRNEINDSLRKTAPLGARTLKGGKKKYSILEVRKAGDIAVNKWRWNVKIKILN